MSQNTASHDFAAQQAETFAVYADLQSKHGLPEMADVDYFFVPTSDEADWRPLADVLSRQDYVCQYIEDDDGEGPYLMATLSPSRRCQPPASGSVKRSRPKPRLSMGFPLTAGGLKPEALTQKQTPPAP